LLKSGFTGQQKLENKLQIDIILLYMKSIATVSLGGELQEKFQAISLAGFEGVELTLTDLENFDGTLKELKALADDYNLKIIALQPLRDYEGCSRGHLQDKHDQLEKIFDTMGELNIQTTLLCSNVADLTVSSEDLMAEDLQVLADLAAKRNLLIGYEALSWGSHIKTYMDAWRLVKMVDSPSLGIVLDTFHTFCLEDSLEHINLIPMEKVFFTQIADAPRLPIDVKRWSREFRCFPGYGDFDVPSFLRALFDNGYKGVLSLEIFNNFYATVPPLHIASLGFSSLSESILQARSPIKL
jgi:4-hydroxyphenylpyruvate dioxygenase